LLGVAGLREAKSKGALLTASSKEPPPVRKGNANLVSLFHQNTTRKFRYVFEIAARSVEARGKAKLDLSARGASVAMAPSGARYLDAVQSFAAVLAREASTAVEQALAKL
jgi:hypothetical protein